MTLYHSKIDHWLWIAIAVIYISCIIPIFTHPIDNWTIYLLTLIITNIIPISLIINVYTNTYYTIDEEKLTLKIKSGILVDTKLDINKITKIRKTRTWLSSPALSMDRLEITTDKHKKAVISPKNKSQFITHLLTLNPNIKIEN